MLTRDEVAKIGSAELLIRIMQEAGEVVQAASKQMLFGPRPTAPSGKEYNNIRDTREEFEQLHMLMDEHAKRWGWK